MCVRVDRAGNWICTAKGEIKEINLNRYYLDALSRIFMFIKMQFLHELRVEIIFIKLILWYPQDFSIQNCHYGHVAFGICYLPSTRFFPTPLKLNVMWKIEKVNIIIIVTLYYVTFSHSRMFRLWNNTQSIKCKMLPGASNSIKAIVLKKI